MSSNQSHDDASSQPFMLDCSADLGSGPLPVFPLLMRAAFSPATTALARPIIRGTNLPNIPWVTMCYLMPIPGSLHPNRIFIREERAIQLGKSEEDFRREAIFNVSLRAAHWSLAMPGVLECTDDYLSAERILDQAFLRQASGMLADDSLLVAIPARGHLFATGLSSAINNSNHALAFQKTIESIFNKAGDGGITPWSFTIQSGKITSVLEIG